MTIDQIAIFMIVGITFCLFVWGKLRYDIVAIISLFILFVADAALGGEKSSLILNPSNLFNGFGHPAVVTVAAVLIISKSLQNSGVVDFIARKIEPFSKNQTAHISSLSGVAAICSGIMNNVGALALMMPVALKTSARQKRSPSIILMPLAFASILGGMITMIGTPPNIIIATFRGEYQQKIKQEAIADVNSSSAIYFDSINVNPLNFEPAAFGMLDFTPVGLSIALFGVLFTAFIGWRFIPKSSHKSNENESLFSIDDYITEIRIPEDSPLIDKKIGQIEKFTDGKVSILGRIDDKGKLIVHDRNSIICQNDRYLIKSDPIDLKQVMDQYKIRFTKQMRKRIDRLKDGNTAFKEVLITPDSPLVGRNRTYLRRRSSNSLILMAVARKGQPILKRLENIKFQIGDVLLLQGNDEGLKYSIGLLGLIPLAYREIQVGIFSKVGLSLLIFGVSIALSILGILPITVSFILAILAYIFTGILPIRDIYKNIDWPIIVLLGAMIPISEALQSTGSSQLLADFMVNSTVGYPPWFILSIIMIITMCLSDIINNAATALIMAPISAGIAISLGVSTDPFLMSVAVGASCAFLTPIGHQCNALILGPGGYRFSDYWKMGLPLEIIIILLGTPIILYFWPL